MDTELGPNPYVGPAPERVPAGKKIVRVVFLCTCVVEATLDQRVKDDLTMRCHEHKRRWWSITSYYP